MKLNLLTFVLLLVLLPGLSYGRCRTVGESASLGTEYGTFPLYPAQRVIANGEHRDNVALQWVGYAIGLPLFVVAMPFGMVGAGVGAALHPWTKCDQHEKDRHGILPSNSQTSQEDRDDPVKTAIPPSYSAITGGVPNLRAPTNAPV